MSENTAIAKKENFNLMPMDTSIASAISEELDGLGEITFDFIKIPSGGGLAFEVPGDDQDNPDLEKELVGVIVDHHPVNCYWRDSYSGENTAPDCASIDGHTGIVKETGEACDCKTCPYNQYGSDENGIGKACKNTHRIYLLRAGEMLPYIISLPPTSLKNFKQYLSKSILLKGKRSQDVITKITLQKDKNAAGITYSKASFSRCGVLSAEEIAAVLPTVNFVKSISRSITEFENEADNLPFDDN